MFIIVFAETGMLIGFFLPGDSLLVTAGLLATTPVVGGNGEYYLNVYYLILLLIPATLFGDSLGYYIGFKAGPKLFRKEQSFFFRKDYLLKTKAFYEKYGGITISIARFMPIIRTFAAVVAGIGQMPYRKFLKYDILGGVSWVLSMILIGYFLGRVIPNIDKHIEKVIIIVVFASLLPAIIKYLSGKLKSKKEGENIN